MTPKGHAIPSKTQLLSYGTPALWVRVLFYSRAVTLEGFRRWFSLEQNALWVFFLYLA